MSLPRDHAGILKLIMKHGWKKKLMGSGHWKLTGPEGQIVHAAATPRDKQFAGVKLRRDLVAAGFRLKKREEYVAPPAPKLVVDRSESAEAQEVVVAENSKRGTVPEAILFAFEKLGDAEAGRSSADLIDHVRLKLPDYKLSQLSVALPFMERKGILMKVALGRYRINPNPVVVERKKRAVAGVGEVGDLQVLEEALATLAKLEKLVKKYKELGEKLAGFRGLFGG
jgi:hypothetical protein